ncbi:MAG: hypothetical protein COS99_04775 [Candidatus Omnitrophica bacterium CG07_land_8_20_14_0_80_42_15]|uniref:Rod shape-determining protein MreD n=1 Tax=Candidatus Aquitaenariimonas noxiae TaxID=1974741 RepID=A0A2J0KSS2_9BACT|nr:MAG: hypothetical protein COS99_04775 [Candidatus Omnitrophica bacterium CG07_land_8_20_14_0_80_42_15]
MIALMMIMMGITMRFLPHPYNVTPIAAIALFSGVYLNKKYAPWVPLAIMILSDLVIGLHNVIAYTWGSFILVALIGMWLKNNRTVLNIGIAAILSSFLFFVITNFGVWLTWYPRSITGLINCYTLAIPFYRSTLLGGIMYTAAFFGLYELSARAIRNTKFAYLAN